MKDDPTRAGWLQANQRCLMAEAACTGAALDEHATRRAQGDQPAPGMQARRERAAAALAEARASMPAPAGIDVVVSLFGLSVFERSILVLCAAVELDGSFAARCAAAHGDPLRTHPTAGLALALFEQAHWSALTPAAPLRHWRLIEVGAGPSLTASPLRIDERVLHFLAGINELDERLAPHVEAVRSVGVLAPSQAACVDLVLAAWGEGTRAPLPVVQLCGGGRAEARALAAAIGERLGLGVYALGAGALPSSGNEAEALQRLWEREAALGGHVCLLECDDLDHADAARAAVVRRWIERTRGPLLVATREPRGDVLRTMFTVEVRKPSGIEQRALWLAELGAGGEGMNGHLDGLVAQFNLGASGIRAAARHGLAGASDPARLAEGLWDACRVQSRPRLDELAQRIETSATWDDLVLPERALQPLRDIAVHLRQRARVFEGWGFAARSARGLGLSALFSGPSGTGKTLAAEVLAAELRLDLYRIDLSQVVSKYIGETEKNLRRVFDAAEEGGAVLLFDEADALFGKRSEVKDSHDRFANIEVSYLLQRMEAYRGLAILTTNLRDALDPAFLRRLRFVVPFSFPDLAQRAEIWRRIFPRQTPLDGIDPLRLARLNVAGGNIRNIALNAAFLAAEEGGPVRTRHIAQAARGEYAKLEKPLTATESEALA